MKVEEIKEWVERQPFRPFAIRLSNRAQYAFNNSKDIGAPKDYHIIFYFGEKEAVLIDAESVVEIFAR